MLDLDTDLAAEQAFNSQKPGQAASVTRFLILEILSLDSIGNWMYGPTDIRRVLVRMNEERQPGFIGGASVINWCFRHQL